MAGLPHHGRKVALPNLLRLGFETMPDAGAPDGHARWIAGYILARRLEHITAHDVGRHYRALRGKHEDADLVMAILVDASWARPVEARKVSKRWEINPAVHVVFAATAAAKRARREATYEALKAKISDL